MISARQLFALIAFFAPIFSAPISSAADALALRYAFEPGTNVVYSVHATAAGRDTVETLHGLVSYAVRAASPAGITLAASATVKRERRAADGFAAPGGPDNAAPSLKAGSFRLLESPTGTSPRGAGTEIQLDPFGKILRDPAGGSGARLIGNLLTAVFDPLPLAGRAVWRATNECLVTAEIRGQETWLPSREQIFYTLENSTPSVATFRRQYDLRTAPGANRALRMSFSGEGTNTFDIARGIPQSVTFSGTLDETTDAGAKRTEVRISFKVIEGSELAAARAALKPSTKPMKAMTASDYSKLMTDLAGDDPLRQRAAAGHLAEFAPAGDRDAVAEHLASLARRNDAFLRQAALRALAVWGTRKHEGIALGALDDSETGVRHAAIDLLAALATPRCAQALAESLMADRDFGKASAALRKIGPPAEDVVMKLLDSRDAAVQREACQILKIIGTKKSAAALASLSKSPDTVLALLAKEAAKAAAAR